jgi:hypothetical protein
MPAANVALRPASKNLHGGGLPALGYRFSKADIGGASTAHLWRQAVTKSAHGLTIQHVGSLH